MSQSDLMAGVLSDLRDQLSGKTHLWAEQADEISDSILERLKEAPPEAAVEFALTGLRLIRMEQSWFSHMLNRIVGGVLRPS